MTTLQYTFKLTVFDQTGNTDMIEYHTQLVGVGESGIPFSWEVTKQVEKLQEEQFGGMPILIEHELSCPFLIPGSQPITSPNRDADRLDCNCDSPRCPHCFQSYESGGDYANLTFDILYFKAGGKFYTEGKLQHRVSMSETGVPAISEVAYHLEQLQRRNEEMAGLSSSGKEFHIVITHPLCNPILLPCLAE